MKPGGVIAFVVWWALAIYAYLTKETAAGMYLLIFTVFLVGVAYGKSNPD